MVTLHRTEHIVFCCNLKTDKKEKNAISEQHQEHIYICSLHILQIWDIGVKLKSFLFPLNFLQEISSLLLTRLDE